MTQLEVWFLAFSLAMDCFTVAVATGIMQQRVRVATWLTMSVLFGLFQGVMPLFGWLGTSYFYNLIGQFDHWIAFGLLSFVGGQMIFEGMKGGDNQHHFDPTRLSVMLALAVATSIDALAVGISFTCVGMTTWEQVSAPVVIIGLVSLVMSLVGYGIGVVFGRRFRFPVEPIGGLILLAIGCRILYEHLAI